MSQSGAMTKDVDIDIGALFASLRRNALFILCGAALIAVLVWVICLLATPEYRAETRILIEMRESIYTRPNGETSTERPLLDPEGIKSQVEVVTSTELLKTVAQKLNLTANENFNSARVGPLGQVLILLGMKSNPANLTVGERVLRVMRENLKVFEVTGSRVIVVQFTSSDPKMAAELSNAIADAYIAQQSAAKLQSNDDATGWLAPEIKDLSQRVREAEAKVAQYRASSDLLTGQGTTTIAAQQLSEISTELSRVRASRSAAEAKSSSIRNALAAGVAVDTLPDVVASGLMQRLRERRVQLNAEIADLSSTLLDGHPRIKSLRSQLSDLDQQIRGEGRKILTSFENEATAAKAREEQLTRELNGMKSQAARAGDEEVELRALEREATAQRELLESYLSSYRQAASRTDSNYVPADARVFSRADTPSEPYFPRTLPIVSASFVAGLLLLSVATLLRELFSGRAFLPANPTLPASTVAAHRRDEPDYEELADVTKDQPELATPVVSPIFVQSIQDVYEEQIQPKDTLPENPNGVHAVATQLIQSTASRVLVASPEGDDASAATLALVRELSDRKLRTILIDMTGSGVLGHAMLDSDQQAGITDLLVGAKKFTDIIHNDHYSDAHIIPLGQSDPRQAMRSKERLPMVLDALGTAYDRVVVECGPSTAPQIEQLASGRTQIILSIVDPEAETVALAAHDLDQRGFDDVIILAAEAGADA